MPLDSPEAWGAAIAAAVASVGVDNSAPVTQAQLIEIWTKVKTEDHTQLTTKAQGTGTVTSGAGAGGGVAILPGGIT